MGTGRPVGSFGPNSSPSGSRIVTVQMVDPEMGEPARIGVVGYHPKLGRYDPLLPDG